MPKSQLPWLRSQRPRPSCWIAIAIAGAQVKQCWIKYWKNPKKFPLKKELKCSLRKILGGGLECYTLLNTYRSKTLRQFVNVLHFYSGPNLQHQAASAQPYPVYSSNSISASFNKLSQQEPGILFKNKQPKKDKYLLLGICNKMDKN